MMKTQQKDLKTLADEDIKNICRMFVKGSFPSKYMDSWQRFNEMSLPVKKELYNNLTIVSITDPYYKQAKRVWEDFGIQT